MNQENNPPSNDLDHETFSFVTFRKKLDNIDDDQSSITPKRPLLSSERVADAYVDISPLSDRNSRSEQAARASVTPVAKNTKPQSPIATVETCMFIISPPQPERSTVLDDEDTSYVPAYVHKKAKPAPSTTWKAPFSVAKSSASLKASTDAPLPVSETQPTTIISFQPAIRARVPFNLSSASTIDKQTHSYTTWLNTLFTPMEFLAGQTTTTTTTGDPSKTWKALAESNRWYTVRDRAREVFTRDVQSIAAKISADIDIDQSRINPKADLNFGSRTVSRQALLNFIASYNRTWFRLAMEVLFPINIEHSQQIKLAIEQYLIQSTGNTSSPLNTTENNAKKTSINPKTASIQIRLTVKNLIIIVIFLERAKLLRLIDQDPCLYMRESKFKSTKDSLDVLSRDFISSDTNLIRRLKLAGFEPIYRQTSLDEYNYLISNENKLIDEMKDGIRLTRCAQILLASNHEQVARFDLSMKLKCPVVNLVHKLLNIDQAFELLQTYGQVNLTGISNKDIMNGNKQRTLELLWRLFVVCYLPKHLSPIEKLNNEISILSRNLSTFSSRSVEQQLIANDLAPLQKQQIDFSLLIRSLLKWTQLVCAHYKFWLSDLQVSFADGRALLYLISYYHPSLCDYNRDIKHMTTLAVCQTRDEHMQFNLELGLQPANINAILERNVKGNFRLLEECIKQFGTFSSDLIKYEHYAKDIPDERCTIIILAMLAHDLLFSNNSNEENDFRHQPIFEELHQRYPKEEEPPVEIKKEDTILGTPEMLMDEIEIIQEMTLDSSEQIEETSSVCQQMFDDTNIATSSTIEQKLEYSLKELSISSTTINYPIEESISIVYPIPIIQSEPMETAEKEEAKNEEPEEAEKVEVEEEAEEEEEEENAEEDTTKVTMLSSYSPNKQDWSLVEPPPCVYDQTLSDSLYASLETMFAIRTPPPSSSASSLSHSVLLTMNHDILDHLEPLLPESDDDNDDSFNSARSGLTTMMDPRRNSIAAVTAALSFEDFVELEKTLETETTKNNLDINSSLFLVDESTPSEVDSVEMNKMDDVSFADPVNTKMIKETLTLFLAHQHQTIDNDESVGLGNESLQRSQNDHQQETPIRSEAELKTHAAKIVQAHWRGLQVRVENERNHHPIVPILEKIRALATSHNSSLTLRERMMQIVQEYSDAPSSSLTAYLHFLRDMEPIVACCIEIRYLIAQQGLLRLFFILMRCCNRSGPSAVLLSKVLSTLQLFTVKRGLIMRLIDKQEQIKDFIMLLLKYYQKNRCELFGQICSLLEAIVHDEHARKTLQSNKSFTGAIEYIYKRVFNKASIEDEKYRQQVRSTPKQSTGSTTRRMTLLNQSSLFYPTPKMMRPSIVPIDNVFKKNLVSLERFMKMFYRD